MAYMYRNVSDADLKAHIQIYSSDQAKWLSRIAMNTLKQGMQHASARTGERLVAFMKSQGAPAPAVETASRAAPAENPSETAAPPSAEELRVRGIQLRRGVTGEERELIGHTPARFVIWTLN